MLHRFLGILLIVFIAGAAYGQFPATGNKSRLGWQTTGDGLIYRGTLADTTSIKPTGLNNAYFLLDTVNAVLYRYIKTQGGWQRAQAEGDLLHVLEGGANSAGLSISGELVNDGAFLVVDGNNATPWDGLRAVGYFSQRVRDEVTIQGSGLITITETAATAGGTITIDASIPPNYITSNLLSQGVRDSLATDVTIEQGGQVSATIIVDGNNATPWDGLYVIGITETIGTEGEVVLTIDGQTVTFQIGSNLSFPDTSGVIALENNQGTDVYFAPGENIALSSSGDTVTIAAPLSLSVSQGSLGPAFVVVDNNTALPWDGTNVIGYFATQTIGVTLQLNNESVTFYPVQDGNKTDITVTGNGEVWNLNNGVVDWATLSQDVKDSIEARLINPADSLQFVTTYEGSAATPGKMIWNSQSGTLHLGMAGGIEMPIGQGEAHMVRNVTGSAIAKGKVVYISGATGQRPQISLADADAEMSSSGTFGITAEAIDNNDTGFVFTSGYIKGINTSALTEGEALWLDTTPGGFTHTKPTAPIHAVLVGYVITKKNNGTIFVKIQNGYELGELHDVSTQGKAAQDILRYNGTIWQPGKDTSLYNMDARLKGNRLVSMGTADLQFRKQAGGADFVQIRPTYVSVENTSTTNNAVLTQYGLQSGSGTIPNNVLSQIYLNGEFSVYTNAATSVPGTEPDLYIDGNGKTRFRVSAPGALDSLYGKNATGELTAIKNTLGDTVLYIERKDTAAMLQPYLRKADTLSMLSTYISNADTLGMLSTYISNADTATMLSTYISNADTLAMLSTYISNADTSGMLSSYISAADTATMLNPYLRKADTLSLSNRINGKLDSLAGAVMTANLRDTAVTTAKIATGAVTGAKLGSMTSSQVAGAVTDETGKGKLVFADSATVTGLNIENSSGAPASLRLNFNTSGTATGRIDFNRQNNIYWTYATDNSDNLVINRSGDNRAMVIKQSNGFAGFGGILDPLKALHVFGEARITDLDNGTANKLVGANNDGDLDSISIGSGLTLSGGALRLTSSAEFFSMVVFGFTDTITNITTKNFIVIPSKLAGYCLDSYQVRAGSGTGSTDVQIRLESATYAPQTVSGTTNYNKDLNVTVSSGDRIRIDTFNTMGTLIGLSVTLEFNPTCN